MSIIKTAGKILCMAILVMVVYWMNLHGTSDNVDKIEFIQAHCYNQELIDLQNEIGVQTEEDIKWYYDKHDTLVIEYGKILLKYDISDFVTAETQEMLNSVFITTEQDPNTLEFTLYWNGKELTKYVKK